MTITVTLDTGKTVDLLDVQGGEPVKTILQHAVWLRAADGSWVSPAHIAAWVEAPKLYAPAPTREEAQ